MSTDTPPTRTIELITREDEHLSRSGKVELVSKTLDVGQLREHFKEFMASLQSIIEIDNVDGGPFQLGEIQFSAEITASGEFKLFGTGVGMDASSAVTFVLKRRM